MTARKDAQKAIILLSTTILFVGAAINPALACTQKSDCSGNDICCMVPDEDMSEYTTFKDDGPPAGSCMSRDACNARLGDNLVYEPDAECGDGTSFMTCKTTQGSSVSGCFAQCPN